MSRSSSPALGAWNSGPIDDDLPAGEVAGPQARARGTGAARQGSRPKAPSHQQKCAGMAWFPGLPPANRPGSSRMTPLGRRGVQTFRMEDQRVYLPAWEAEPFWLPDEQKNGSR